MKLFFGLVLFSLLEAKLLGQISSEEFQPILCLMLAAAALSALLFLLGQILRRLQCESGT